MGATWNKKLTEDVAMAVGDETLAAGTMQAWSPVLDVAQDARWGRCEETFGEDPVLVSQIGGAWIKGYQSKGLFTTPKHFGGHGAPWADVIPMISVCPNVKCVRCIWFRSVM